MQLKISHRELKALSNNVYKLSLSTTILDSRRFKASGAIYHPVYCVETIGGKFEMHKLISALAGHCKHTRNMFYLLPVILDAEKMLDWFGYHE